MIRLVIDTDPGVDDAHAILAAFAHPDAQVEAITTVAGNVSLERTTANACTILDVLEQDVPVYAGCEGPMVGPVVDAGYFHGKDGLGDSGYPPSPRPVADEHAVNALIRMANESPGELTLAAIGPLTNVAMATRLDPSLPEKYKQLVVMGGTIRGTGNTTTAAEFNFYADPEAVAVVLDSWPGFALASWETTMAYPFAGKRLESLLAVDSPKGEFFKRITAPLVEKLEQILGHKSMLEPDLLAVAVALEPDIVQRAERHNVRVELAGQVTRGHTTVDWHGRSGGTPNVNVILELDHERLWEMLEAGVR